MNLKRCGNGHYYDADEYPSCPKCKGQEKEPEKKEPVTGWLVCTEGGHYGQVYELRKGKNRVGGSADMDIPLTADSQVPACCQVAVAYDEEKKVFLATVGEARELSYINGQVLLFEQELHSRDVILVGGSKLMFIPLCGPDFSWEDGTEKH
ncbi:MAG: hypothetical protein HFG59_02155 [Lachnospiraceae bacterium]|nr:hypothetical protein [Lachnospiraceae bacterium]